MQQHNNVIMFLGNHWRNTNLTYSIMNTTSKLPQSIVETRIQEAFDMWASKTPLTFTRLPPHTIETDQADILIYFTGGQAHAGLDEVAFDGPGGTFAHTYYPPRMSYREFALEFPDQAHLYPYFIRGDAHFDWSEYWTDNAALGKPIGIYKCVSIEWDGFKQTDNNKLVPS